MLTPQEVEERVFPKARKGGYDMQDVDNFLDQLTADYTELYKENAVLKRKMKVLADKITEYQETEGAMRSTLLAAQKMANEIVEEAKAKRDKILGETESVARERATKLAEQVTAEEARLKSAKASLAAMVSGIQDLLTHEQEFLASLPEADVTVAPETGAQPDPAADDAVVAEIGDSISRMMAEPDAPAEEEQQPEEPAVPVMAEIKGPEATEETDNSPTRRMDLSELRFGRNYEIK